jgi:hypothetical protein
METIIVICYDLRDFRYELIDRNIRVPRIIGRVNVIDNIRYVAVTDISHMVGFRASLILWSENARNFLPDFDNILLQIQRFCMAPFEKKEFKFGR